MDARNNFFSERAARQWQKLPREVRESASLEVLKHGVDVALRDLVSGHGGGGLVVRLDNLSGSFQSESSNGSMHVLGQG